MMPNGPNRVTFKAERPRKLHGLGALPREASWTRLDRSGRICWGVRASSQQTQEAEQSLGAVACSYGTERADKYRNDEREHDEHGEGSEPC